MDKNLIDRINFLARKKKNIGLTQEELKEQEELRNEYRRQFRANLMNQVSNIRVVKYDKDIDISKIVNVQHVVVCDSENKIYLIAYNVDGYYAESEDDKQVLESFGIVQ